MQLPLFEVLVQARLTMVDCGDPRERSAATVWGTSCFNGLEMTQGFVSVQTN